MAQRLTMNPDKSLAMCAASVSRARLFEMKPPENIFIIKLVNNVGSKMEAQPRR